MTTTLHASPMMISGNLFLVGAGKMGSAMLDGWLNSCLKAEQVTILDPGLPETQTSVRKNQGVRVNPDEAGKADILLLAVKPQIMEKVLKTCGAYIKPDTLVVSVAAGIPVAYFEAFFGPSQPIIRCMPNTPAAVGKGMTVLFGNAPVGQNHRSIAQTLLSAVGDTAWIETEEQMDAVTGLSGSGPAYVFHMIEAMTEAGIMEGLPADLARQLARTTVAGAGALVMESGEEAAILRENVTSPNGTTAAGLAVLMNNDNGLPPLMKATVKAAADRSRELGKT